MNVVVLLQINAFSYHLSVMGSTRGIQKVLRQILKNILFTKFTKLFFYIVSIQFITLEKFQDEIFRWKHRLQKCYELDGNYVEK